MLLVNVEVRPRSTDRRQLIPELLVEGFAQANNKSVLIGAQQYLPFIAASLL